MGRPYDFTFHFYPEGEEGNHLARHTSPEGENVRLFIQDARRMRFHPVSLIRQRMSEPRSSAATSATFPTIEALKYEGVRGEPTLILLQPIEDVYSYSDVKEQISTEYGAMEEGRGMAYIGPLNIHFAVLGLFWNPTRRRGYAWILLTVVSAGLASSSMMVEDRRLRLAPRCYQFKSVSYTPHPQFHLLKHPTRVVEEQEAVVYHHTRRGGNRRIDIKFRPTPAGHPGVSVWKQFSSSTCNSSNWRIVQCYREYNLGFRKR